MTSLNRLQSRKDVDNADIPEIIDRAERLRQRHLTALEREQKRSSIQEVKHVGRELSIPDSFIEQAIVELYKERQTAKLAAHKKSEKRNAVNTSLRVWISRVISIILIIVGIIVLIRCGEWLWFVLDFTPVQNKSNEPEVIVQERVVRETVVRTVQETVVSSSDSKPITTTASEVSPSRESEHPNTLPMVIHSKDTVEVPTLDVSTPVPSMLAKVEGEWGLDAYLLYEKGVEFPVEIPIVYEPLELPKTWRFTNGKYKRVMDADLIFTARFEMMTLPASVQPNLDEQGEWVQIVASNVVSSIPGIRRQNDYFAVFLGQDTMTIWYLGPNTDSKKIPSQAERYRRK